MTKPLDNLSTVRTLPVAVFFAALVATLALLPTGYAQARDNCTTKPAVCGMKEWRLSRYDQAAAASEEAPLLDADRCTTKPAVCSRMRAQAQRAPEQTHAKPTATAERCTTKPAVCSRLRRMK